MELAAAFKRLGWIANLGGMFGGSMVIHLLPDLAVTIGVPPDRPRQAAGVLAGRHHRDVSAHALRGLLALPPRARRWRRRRWRPVGLVVIARGRIRRTLLIGLALLGQLVGYNYFSGLFYSTAGSSHEGPRAGRRHS